MCSVLVRLTLSATLLLSGGTALCQDVLVVDPAGGPGIDAVEIFDAVELAAPGDTILVRSGIYQAFTIDALPLSVIADTGAAVTVNGEIRVVNLAAGQTVLLRGLQTGTPQLHGLAGVDNLGALRVEACEFLSEDGAIGLFGFGADGMHFWNCADVVVTRCESLGGAETPILLPARAAARRARAARRSTSRL